MDAMTAWKFASDSSRRAWRCICVAAVLVMTSLIAGLVVFSWLAASPAARNPATAAADERPGEPVGAQHVHIRF